jgi:hypothetical protein
MVRSEGCPQMAISRRTRSRAHIDFAGLNGKAADHQAANPSHPTGSALIVRGWPSGSRSENSWVPESEFKRTMIVDGPLVGPLQGAGIRDNVGRSRLMANPRPPCLKGKRGGIRRRDRLGTDTAYLSQNALPQSAPTGSRI